MNVNIFCVGLLFLTLCWLSSWSRASSTNSSCIYCGNGLCQEETGICECFPGWKGQDCSTCGGKIKLNSTKGWIANAIGNYSIDAKCTWLIEAPSNDSKIRLHIKEFATECGWDHLYIYDGNSVFSDLKAVFSGIVREKERNDYSQRVPEIVSESGSMLVHFSSDAAYNMMGFNITYNIDSCPSQYDDLICSGHGSCHKGGQCVCDEDFTGEACHLPACPENCAPDGNQQGKCNKEAKQCDCFDGWTGESCSQEVMNGYWEIPKVTGLIPPSRSSHSAIVDGNKMWIIGGEMFSHNTNGEIMIIRALVQDDGSFQWEEVGSTPQHGPSNNIHYGPTLRYGHSAVFHDGKIYMYGGTKESGQASGQLWSLDLTTTQWELVKTEVGRCREGTLNICGPIHISGHTATIVSDNRMVVIFGYSPQYGYLNIVQEYNFGKKEWSIVETKGYPVRGGYGHSAVWDGVNEKIYVYGGYVSKDTSAAILSQDLYSYDPVYSVWKLLSPSNSYRYLHSAVFSKGLMIVYGGNTHNDTSFSQGTKCFSDDLLMYDISCDKWYNMQSTILKDIKEDLSRFGHSMVMFNDTIVLYGGFHGVLKSDIIRFIPGQCNVYQTRNDCLSLKNKPGVKCVWNKKDHACEFINSNNTKSSYDICLKSEANVNEGSNKTEFCSSLNDCSSCTSTSVDCIWCHQGSSDRSYGKCSFQECRGTFVQAETHLENCTSKISTKNICSNLHTCHSCKAHMDCEWDTDYRSRMNYCRKRKNSSENVSIFDGNECKMPCSKRDTCKDCTNGMCMWCKSLGKCIDRNAYLASFPYGQCMDWTTSNDACPAPNDICLGHNTCESCRANPACGWCDDGSRKGTCQMGGANGPLKEDNDSKWILANTCKAVEGKTWHFTDCPLCQCNGHSQCTGQEGICNQPCMNNTAGNHCERCREGYYGNPINDGNCTQCMCNGHGSACNHRTGKCHCSTKGVIGDNCEKCDRVEHYFGNPRLDSCFYELASDYEFTFNLSKPIRDQYITAINFKYVPTKADVDVDFSVSCSVISKMNLTVRYTPAGSTDIEEDLIFIGKNCGDVKHRFSKSNYVFGDEEKKTTFYVYAYDFQTPIQIIISFSQPERPKSFWEKWFG